MATFDSAYCLALFKSYAGLQAANEYDDNADLYPRLARSQNTVIQLIAQRYPKALYQQPIPITSSDGGKTFPFGNDPQGNPIVPMGWVQIAPTLNAFQGKFFSGWTEDWDFMDEGTHIRMKGTRVWTGTLFARFVPVPPDITATVQPILQPAAARELIVIDAVKEWAGEGGLLPNVVQAMEQKWADKFPSWCLTYRSRYKGGGALLSPILWWLSPDIGGSIGPAPTTPVTPSAGGYFSPSYFPPGYFAPTYFP
jgi:hypothetical protein